MVKSANMDLQANMYYYYSLDCKVFVFCFLACIGARLGCRPSVFSTVGSHLDCKVILESVDNNSDFLGYTLVNFSVNFSVLVRFARFAKLVLLVLVAKLVLTVVAKLVLLVPYLFAFAKQIYQTTLEVLKVQTEQRFGENSRKMRHLSNLRTNFLHQNLIPPVSNHLHPIFFDNLDQ